MSVRSRGVWATARRAIFIALGAALLAILGWTVLTARAGYDLSFAWRGDRLYAFTYRDAPVTITGLVVSGPPERAAEIKPPARFPQGSGELPAIDTLDWRDQQGNRVAPPNVGTLVRALYRWE